MMVDTKGGRDVLEEEQRNWTKVGGGLWGYGDNSESARGVQLAPAGG